MHPRTTGTLIAAVMSVGLLSGAPSSQAQDVVDITIDFAKLMKLDAPADTIVIGNPGIADATVQDENTLVLTGRAAGTTNMIILDKDGKEIANTIVRVASDTRQLTTIFYGTDRQTFSCSPICEQVISVGDSEAAFGRATAQIQTRGQFASGQTGGGE